MALENPPEEEKTLHPSWAKKGFCLTPLPPQFSGQGQGEPLKKDLAPGPKWGETTQAAKITVFAQPGTEPAEVFIFCILDTAHPGPFPFPFGKPIPPFSHPPTGSFLPPRLMLSPNRPQKPFGAPENPHKGHAPKKPHLGVFGF